MTRRPQNGPSFSKAPYKKQKPLSDEELAEAFRKKKEREAELVAKSASGRRFSAAVRANGGSIPLRGGNAAQFWGKLSQADAKDAGQPSVTPLKK